MESRTQYEPQSQETSQQPHDVNTTSPERREILLHPWLSKNAPSEDSDQTARMRRLI